MTTSPIQTELDFDRLGSQIGTLAVPYSYNLSGWSQLQIPIASIARGTGPTVLLMAGNHGDEYPGQIAIMRLMRSLSVDQITGRIIMIPALNMPACQASTRLSPLDGKNLNRCFPGDPGGSVTDVIAHYLTTELFPRSDIVIDLHTGGRGVCFYPCAHMHLVDDLEQRQRMARGTLAFNTDFAFLYTDIAGTGLLPVEAESQGKTVLTTELGGGEVTPRQVHRTTQEGLRNVLNHLGVLAGEFLSRDQLGLPPTRWVQSLRSENYLFAPESGLYESLVELGDDVTPGQPLGAIHYLERPDRECTIIESKTRGVLIAHRGPTVTRQGDIAACVAEEVPDSVVQTF